MNVSHTVFLQEDGKLLCKTVDHCPTPADIQAIGCIQMMQHTNGSIG